MPIVPIDLLKSEIEKAKAAWTPKISWLHNLNDLQRQALLGVHIDRAKVHAAIAEAIAEAPLPAFPPSFDWRNKSGKNFISPVKNQGGCGSCVSFCTVAVVEAMAAIEKGVFFLDLSEADQHFCSSHGANCGGWWPPDAFGQIQSRGVVNEGDFPYNSAFPGPHCLPVADRDHKITKIGSIKTLNTMAERKSWIANVGPVSCVIHVYDDFFSAPANGVYRHVTGGHAGYHCVEVIGYSDFENCWICKNSWDTTFADHGFVKIGYGECGIDETSNDHDPDGSLNRFSMWGVQEVHLAPPPAPKLREIEASINSDGRLEVFAAAIPDGAVWNIWQTAAHSGPWSNISPLGGLVKQLVPVLNSDGRLEVFGIGMDNALWHDWQTVPHAGPWSGWTSRGGIVKKIAAARNSDGRIEVFGIGSDDGLYNIWQTQPHAGPWSNWNSLGGKAKDLAVIMNSDGRLELFVIGSDDGIYNNWQTVPHAGPWSGWNSIGGKGKKIRVNCNSDGRLEVFVIGMDDAVWNNWQTHPHAGPLSGWNSLGGKLKEIDTQLNSDGRLEVFGIGMDDALWHTWQTAPHAGPWSGWNSLGGKVKHITSFRNSDGRLEAFGIGMDDGLWNIWQINPHAAPWSAWNKLA